MEFNVFVENVMEILQEKLGADYEISITKVAKNNGITLTGVIMMREEDSISPTIYLEEPYSQYRAGADIREIADRIVAVYKAQMRDMDLDMSFFGEFDRVKDRIFHKLVNYGQNIRLLEDVPHFRWRDLAVVFYYAMEEGFLGKASILIRNSHLRMWEQTADTLYETAQCNMKRYMPEMLLPMQELIREMTGTRMGKRKDTRLYVLTNKEKLYGASAMLYSEKIARLAEQMAADLLILPSSVHEVLLLKDDEEGQYDCYRQMVREVNTTQVEPEEVLSYGLYRYNRKKAEIEEIIV